MGRITPFVAAAGIATVVAGSSHAAEVPIASSFVISDVVFVDVNRQAIERIALEDTASKYGEGVIPVGGTGRAQMLAFLEENLRRAERGEISMDVLVISGHSGGRDFHGARVGSNAITFEDIETLSRKYPRAFAQVRHAMFLSCFSGGRVRSAEWETLFPNIISVAGFSGRGPSGAPSANFAADVLEHLLKAEKDAKGAAKLARKLAAKKNRKEWEEVLAGIGDAHRVDWAFRTCGNFYAKNDYKKSDDAVIAELQRNVEACHAGDERCSFETQKFRDLNTFVQRRDGLQHDLAVKLIHQKNVIRGWYAKNAKKIAATRGILSIPSLEKLESYDRTKLRELSDKLTYEPLLASTGRPGFREAPELARSFEEQVFRLENIPHEWWDRHQEETR